MPDDLDRMCRKARLDQDSRAHRVIDVVIDVRHDVGHPGDLAFNRAGAMFRRRADRHAVLALRMARNAVANLPRQVQPMAIVLEHVDDAQALLVMIESAGYERAQDPLAGVAERRVAQVVTKRDRFGQLLVQPQHLRDRPRDLRDLERVRQARAIVVASRREEDLRLVLETTEGLGVDDAIAIALERRADRILSLLTDAAPAVGAFRCLRRQDLPFPLLELLANRRRHEPFIISRTLRLRSPLDFARGDPEPVEGSGLAADYFCQETCAVGDRTDGEDFRERLAAVRASGSAPEVA